VPRAAGSTAAAPAAFGFSAGASAAAAVGDSAAGAPFRWSPSGGLGMCDFCVHCALQLHIVCRDSGCARMHSVSVPFRRPCGRAPQCSCRATGVARMSQHKLMHCMP